jgi:hypothetical protein
LVKVSLKNAVVTIVPPIANISRINAKNQKENYDLNALIGEKYELKKQKN